MKPRFEEAIYLKKARELALRIDKLEKAKKNCPECEGKGDDCKCDEKCPSCGDKMDKGGCMKMGCGGKMSKADMATKDKYCMKNFGKKYSECSKKQKAQCDKAHGKMKKAEPGYKAEKITDVNPAFMAESGGQTKSGYFTTNGKTIVTEDAKKKKKGIESANMEALSSAQNPHEGGGVEREIAAGGKELKKFAGTICSLCGGTNTSGCNIPELKGTNIKACPQFRPL